MKNLDRLYYTFEQHFALSINPENLPSFWIPYDTDTDLLVYGRCQYLLYHHYLYNINVTCKIFGTSTVETDKNKFQVTLDVLQFVPDKVTVKVIGKNVMIKGKHKEKQEMSLSQDNFLGSI
ncbi:alpha-crystallin A chain-like [Vespula pensylvanica]|uniref:alpha-crystallin A chain-like n=1 Tax=Vespula pensylvanica TaxID=30213 RepID=UPI001CBA395C|nr:alpha-crystallin A chain-like [Vespula pensylvanica]